MQMSRRAPFCGVEAAPADGCQQIAGPDDSPQFDKQFLVMSVVDEQVIGRIKNPEILSPAQPASLLPLLFKRHYYPSGHGEHPYRFAAAVVKVVPVPVTNENVVGRVAAVAVAAEEVIAARNKSVASPSVDRTGIVARQREDPLR